MIKLVKQESGHDCGHACLAMLLNKSLDEIKSQVKVKRVSSYHLKIYLSCKYENSYEMKLIGKDINLPEFGILNITFSGGHWIIKEKNTIYCPHYGVVSFEKYFNMFAKNRIITGAMTLKAK